MAKSIATKAPSMEDVAAAAGVCKATVSLALREDPSIPEATRKKVQAAVNRLGYHLHPFVSALMSHTRRRTGAAPVMSIGYVTSHSAKDPWEKYAAYRMFRSVTQQRAEQHNCRLQEWKLGPDGISPQRLHSILRARGITGIIVAPLPGRETKLQLNIEGMSVVGIGSSVNDPCIEQVANDHFDGGLRAVRECYQLGYRRIALAVSDEMSTRLEDRWTAGYRLGMQQLGCATHGLEYRPDTSDGFSQGLPRWAKAAKPDVVIFATYDSSCWSALPLSVGLVSLAVSDVSGASAGIAADWQAIAERSVDHLLLQMRQNIVGPLSERRRYLISSRWLPGRSAMGPGTKRSARPPEETTADESLGAGRTAVAGG